MKNSLRIAIVFLLLTLASRANAFVLLRDSNSTNNASPISGIIGAVMPATVNAGDFLAVNFNFVDTSDATITAASGFTCLSPSSRQGNQFVVQCYKASAAGTEGGATENFILTNTPNEWHVMTDALYDSAGASLTHKSDTQGTGTSTSPTAPGNTADDWDIVEADVNDAVAGAVSLTTANWTNNDLITSGGNSTRAVYMAVTPTAGALPAFTFKTSSDSWSWSYLYITGAAAPTVDYRLRGCASATGGSGSVTPSNPASSGDLMCAAIGADNTTIASAGSWTQVQADATNFPFKEFCTTATGSDNMQFTTGSGSMGACVCAWYDNNGGTLQVLNSSVGSASSSLTATAPSVTVANAVDLLAPFYLTKILPGEIIGNLIPYISGCSSNFNSTWGNDVVGYQTAGATGSLAPASASALTGSAGTWEAASLDIGEPAVATPTPTATSTPTPTPTATPTPVPSNGSANRGIVSVPNWQTTPSPFGRIQSNSGYEYQPLHNGQGVIGP